MSLCPAWSISPLRYLHSVHTIRGGYWRICDLSSTSRLAPRCQPALLRLLPSHEPRLHQSLNPSVALRAKALSPGSPATESALGERRHKLIACPLASPEML